MPPRLDETDPSSINKTPRGFQPTACTYLHSTALRRISRASYGVIPLAEQLPCSSLSVLSIRPQIEFARSAHSYLYSHSQYPGSAPVEHGHVRSTRYWSPPSFAAAGRQEALNSLVEWLGTRLYALTPHILAPTNSLLAVVTKSVFGSGVYSFFFGRSLLVVHMYD